MTKDENPTLASLRSKLAAPVFQPSRSAAGRVSFGIPELDQSLGGGLERGALHEIYAAGVRDLGNATGFAAGLALRAAGTRPIVWVRHDFLDTEAGQLHAPGLAELGLNPSALILVRARDMTAVMRSAREAIRCNALGAVVIEPWDEAPDLSDSRRLTLTAEASGVTALLLVAGSPVPSAAQTRWGIRPAKSRLLEASAPGSPAFFATLLRHRGGISGLEWCLEWDRDSRSFDNNTDQQPAALPRTLVSLPASRQVSAEYEEFRRAG